MRSLNDIIGGFFVFFAIDRFIRLISNGVVEPWAKKRSSKPIVVENYKLAVEFLLLAGAAVCVHKSRKVA